MEDMVQKIRAAVDAREDPDFIIIGRTDAQRGCRHLRGDLSSAGLP